MPLPQKVIDRLTQESPATSGWSKQLLMFSGALLTISLIVYCGIHFSYKPYLESQKREMDSQIQQFSQAISESQQQKIVAFYSQLVNLRSILKNRSSVLPFFSWLERNTQANVYYDKLSFDVATGGLSLGVVAKSLADAEEQLKIFEEMPDAKSTVVGSVAADSSGLWKFNITLTVGRSAFAQTPAERGSP